LRKVWFEAIVDCENYYQLIYRDHLGGILGGTALNWNNHLQLWNQASIKLLDVRHRHLGSGAELRSYQLPASSYLYAARGKARVQMGEMRAIMDPGSVFHGGKGMMLAIEPVEEIVEYVLIMYRALLQQPCPKELALLMESDDPFQEAYYIQPNETATILPIIEKLVESWQQEELLERLQSKMFFYQFVHELFRQLQQYDSGLTNSLQENVVEQAIQYIHQHYAESITLDKLARRFNYSAKGLSRLFKKRTGRGPIDYTIQIRIEKAKELLAYSTLSIEEVAAYVGYEDRLYFSRLFKKHVGFSPGRFKTLFEQGQLGTEFMPASVADRPYEWSQSSIAASMPNYYIEYDNHYQDSREGDSSMYTGTRLTMLATILFCLALFLSACSGAGSGATIGSNGGNSEGTVIAGKGNQDANQSREGQSQTRVVSTIKGEIGIPAQPQRIVVDLYLGSFIALDVKPVGTPELNLKNPYFIEALQGVENIGEYEQVSLEKIVALQPDLIVTGNETAYESYSKIAPTVVVPFGELKDVHAEVSYFGKLLGKEAEAKAWLDEYDNRIATAKAKVDQVIPADATFSIMQDWGKTVGVFGDNFGRGGQAIYTALGRKAPAKHAAEIMEQQSLEVSEEALPEFTGDYVIFTSDKHTLEDLKKDPIWGSLDAVKNNRVYIWKGEKSWYFDPIATLSQTEELAAWLVGQKQ